MTPPDTFELLFRSALSNGFVILAGAGLSIPAPSNLPTAATLLNNLITRHGQNAGNPLPASATNDLGALASHFYKTGTFNYFVETLVNWGPFVGGSPNSGHNAIADMLLCHAVKLGVTTNYDYLVERAAERLGSDSLRVAHTGSDLAYFQSADNSPYFKLHGCAKDRRNTLWCSDQIRSSPWDSRLQEASKWLSLQLHAKDVVFVGFWSDWSYLNEALEIALPNSIPTNVFIVDPSPPAALEAKAPGLWAWANSPGVSLYHLSMSGADFLSELREDFSSRCLRMSLHIDEATWAAAGFPKEIAALYDLRRDLTGVPRTRPVTRLSTNSDQVRRFVTELLTMGALVQGSVFVKDGQRIRVIDAAGRSLSRLATEFECESITPTTYCDLLVCVGAEDDRPLPSSIVRDSGASTIVRSAAPSFVTQSEARKALGIT